MGTALILTNMAQRPAGGAPVDNLFYASAAAAVIPDGGSHYEHRDAVALRMQAFATYTPDLAAAAPRLLAGARDHPVRGAALEVSASVAVSACARVEVPTPAWAERATARRARACARPERTAACAERVAAIRAAVLSYLRACTSVDVLSANSTSIFWPVTATTVPRPNFG